MTTMRTGALLLTALLLAGCARPTPSRVEPVPGKRVEGRQGMVSASHPDAAAAGMEILRAGGNAVDAAVATAFALAVVDPSQTGLGGGGAATLWLKGRATTLDFMSAAGADTGWNSTAGGRAGSVGMGRGAATPGAVAGLLTLLEKHGTLPRQQVIAPALRLARDGFIVSPLLSRTIASSANKLKADSAAYALFVPNDLPLQPGDRLVQPALAATLERIANEGRAGFYGGDVARRLSAKVRSLGGLITEQDLRDFEVYEQRPVCSRFAGYTLLSAPPTLSGMSVAQSLGIFERALPTEARGRTLAESPRGALVLVDALRIADADRSRYRGDPRVHAVPSRGISSPAFAAERAALVGAPGDSIAAGDPWQEEAAAPIAECAAHDPFPAATRSASTEQEEESDHSDDAWGSNTSHLSVVDGGRNAVSLTYTVGVLFGSGVYTDGFFLNSSAGNFDRRTAGTNRRNLSTMAPTILIEGNELRLVVGAAGSQYIPPAVVQLIVHVAAYGRDLGDAMAAPRLTPNRGREVEMETGWSPEVFAAMRQAGFTIRTPNRELQFGGAHAIQVRKDGVLVGAADPRRDGMAVGY